MKHYNLHIKLTEEEAFMLDYLVETKLTTKSKLIRYLIKELYKKG